MTLVNPHVSEPRVVEIAVRGAVGRFGPRLVALARPPDIHAHNTFEQPRTVQPRPQKVDAPKAGMLVHELLPASVTRLTLTLA